MTKWWLKKPMRMIQTNLREIDVDLDIEQYIHSLKEFSAEVVLFNVGGIIANYPTALPYHYQNPYLKNDLVGDVLKRVHQEGMKFVARFDFSKINEVFLNEKQSWLYVSREQKHINYNGQLHVCVNSEYQQEYAFRILEEVIERYPVDAIFFNMSGYITYDYSENYHGICQCENCKKRFKKHTGMNLPQIEDGDDPIYRRYVLFKHETNAELFQKIAAFIRDKNENIALCNYGLDSGSFLGTDIVRNESNSAMGRALPEWNYSASDHIKMVYGSWKDVAVSNSAVHFIDYPYRHSGVAPLLTGQRLAEAIANGGWMDYYVIGHLNNQDDRSCFATVKKLFKFHQENEGYFTNLRSCADIALVMPEGSSYSGSLKEYRGLFRILSSMHIQFDVIHDSVLNENLLIDDISGYQALVLPDWRNLNHDAANLLNEYVERGGKVLATGASGLYDREGNPYAVAPLRCLGVGLPSEHLAQTQGNYLRISTSDKTDMKGFDDLDIIPLYSEFLAFKDVKESQCTATKLHLIPSVRFGPPEKCYISEESEIAGMFIHRYGEGKAVYLPWYPGKQYEQLSNQAHFRIIKSSLLSLLQMKPMITTNLPAMVEVVVMKEQAGRWLLVSFVNLSGQIGTAFTQTIPMKNYIVTLQSDKKPKVVKALCANQELAFTADYDTNKQVYAVTITIPCIDLLESVAIIY